MGRNRRGRLAAVATAMAPRGEPSLPVRLHHVTEHCTARPFDFASIFARTLRRTEQGKRAVLQEQTADLATAWRHCTQILRHLMCLLDGRRGALAACVDCRRGTRL